MCVANGNRYELYKLNHVSYQIKKKKKKLNRVTSHYHQLENNESCYLCACFSLGGRHILITWRW